MNEWMKFGEDVNIYYNSTYVTIKILEVLEKL